MMLALPFPIEYIIAAACLSTAFILLILLAYIDFKTWLLPNKYVFPFAALGPVFHLSLSWSLLSPLDIAAGGLTGFFFLFFIRMGGNAYYKQDSLGLGDVKLLGGAGLWLGVEGTLFAVIAGSAAGLLHGTIVAAIKKTKTKEPFSITRLKIPAGPGFITGIIGTAFWIFKDLYTA